MEPETESQESPGNVPEGAPATLEADLAATRAALAAAQAERDQALATAQAAAAEAETRVTAAIADLTTAQNRALEAHRRAVLAENRGQVIDELVAGDSTEAIDASLEVAKAAYARVVEAARTQLASTPVPAGASPHAEPSPEALSPLDKITAALTRNGRS